MSGDFATSHVERGCSGSSSIVLFRSSPRSDSSRVDAAAKPLSRQLVAAGRDFILLCDLGSFADREPLAKLSQSGGESEAPFRKRA